MHNKISWFSRAFPFSWLYQVQWNTFDYYLKNKWIKWQFWETTDFDKHTHLLMYSPWQAYKNCTTTKSNPRTIGAVDFFLLLFLLNNQILYILYVWLKCDYGTHKMMCAASATTNNISHDQQHHTMVINWTFRCRLGLYSLYDCQPEVVISWRRKCRGRGDHLPPADWHCELDERDTWKSGAQPSMTEIQLLPDARGNQRILAKGKYTYSILFFSPPLLQM